MKKRIVMCGSLPHERYLSYMFPKVTKVSAWWEEGVRFEVHSYSGAWFRLRSFTGGHRLLLSWNVWPRRRPGSDYRLPVGEYLMSFVKRSAERAEETPQSVSTTDPVWAERYPALFEYLTLLQLDGKARKTSTMNLFAEEGKWKVFLNDRHCDRYCVATGSSVDDCLCSLELQLSEDSADWRKNRPAPKK